MAAVSLGIRWLERDVFATNPALDPRALRRALVPTGDAAPTARQTALLKLLNDRRRRHGPLPRGWRDTYDASLNRAVARLVLDDVLQVRWRSTFVGGARAYRRVFGGATRTRVHERTSLAHHHSLDVLEAAAALPVDTLEELLVALYFGHRKPVTPAARQQFPSPARTLHALLEGADASTRRLLETHWRLSSPAVRGQVWLAWSHRRSIPSLRRALTYKLYVSAELHRVGDVFRGAVPVFTAHDVRAFKIGCDAYQLVRPDKFVAYFDSRAQLDSVAVALRSAFDGMDGHGVPFCAPAGGDQSGLISWGVDFSAVVTSGDERTSWRWWLCERLARFLAAAKQVAATPGAVAPVRFALDRLALDGIDVATFTPTEDFLVEAALPATAGGTR